MGRRQRTRLTGAVAALTVAGAVLFSSAPATAQSNPASGPDQAMVRDTVGGRFEIVRRSDDDSYDVLLNGRALERVEEDHVSIVGSSKRWSDPWDAKDRYVIVEYYTANAIYCSGYMKIFTIAPTGAVSISDTVYGCYAGFDRIETLGEESFALVFSENIYYAPDIVIYDRGAINVPETVAPVERTFDTATGKLGARERSGRLDLSFNGKPLPPIDGYGLHIFGAHPAEVPRLAVFGAEQEGQCHYDWRVGDFTEPGGVHFSEPFAGCRDRPNIVFPPKGGVLMGFEPWADEPAVVFRYKGGSVQQIR